MDLSMPSLIAAFVVSTVGFSVFLYGKKQRRLPQLLGGILMMGVPCFLPDAPWIWAFGGASVVGMWSASRSGL